MLPNHGAGKRPVPAMPRRCGTGRAGIGKISIRGAGAVRLSYGGRRGVGRPKRRRAGGDPQGFAPEKPVFAQSRRYGAGGTARSRQCGYSVPVYGAQQRFQPAAAGTVSGRRVEQRGHARGGADQSRSLRQSVRKGGRRRRSGSRHGRAAYLGGAGGPCCHT